MLYSLDVETTGLDPWRDQVTCVGIYNDNEALVFRSKEAFKAWYAKTKEIEFVTHNGKFDFKFLIVHGWLDLEQVLARWTEDTQYLCHVIADKVPESYLEEYEVKRSSLNKEGAKHRKAGALSLKTLAPYFLNVEPFWEVADHDNDEYVLRDCKYTFDLFEQRFEMASEQERKFYTERMMPWAKMLLKAELKGIEINLWELDTICAETVKKVKELKEKLDEEFDGAHEAYRELQHTELDNHYAAMRDKAIAKLKDPTEEKKLKTWNRYLKLAQDAHNKVERQLNFDSPTQMLWLLKDYMKLDVTTYKGEESTGKAVLERLANEGNKSLRTYLEYRERQKLLSSFIEPYAELHRDGVLHPTFNLCGTRTGRLSSEGPNLQQVPGELYSIFRARKGHTLLQYDMAAIEAKLIAYYSDDRELTRLVQEDLSIHDVNAIDIFDLKCEPKDVKKKYPDERAAAKRLGFSCFYGAGWRRIQQALQEAGYKFSDKECKDILARLKRRFKGAFEFHEEITERILNGEEVINLLGRPIYIENPEDVYMKGFNTLIQSSASDLVLHSALKSGQDVLLLVHDFICTEVPIDSAKQAAEDLVRAMTNYKLTNALGEIKLTVDGCINDRWTK